MEDLIETIRTAVRADALPATREAGLTACRTILAALEMTTSAAAATDATPETAGPTAATTSTAPEATKPTATTASATPETASPTATTSGAAPEATGPTTTPPAAQAPVPPTSGATAPPVDAAALSALFASLGKLPPEQLLDLAIARLRAALPPGTTVPAPAPLRFQLVPLHHLRSTK